MSHGAEPLRGRTTELTVNLQRLIPNPSTEPINPSQGQSGSEKARKHLPAADLPGTWTYSTRSASSHPSPGSQFSESKSSPTLLHQQQQPSSMSGAPPMWYDPDQAVVPYESNYEQWVENYELSQQSQQHTFSQGVAQGVSAGQASFQPQQQQPHIQPHPLLQHAPTHPLSIPAERVQPPPRNQYNFVPDPYVPQPSGQDNYTGHYPQTSAGNRPQRSRLPRTRQGQTSAVPFTFTAPLHAGELADSFSVSGSDYRHQHQSFPLPLSAPTSDTLYYHDAMQSDLISGTDPPPQQNFIFTEHQHPGSSSAPRPSVTPSSDATNVSSLSPRSWVGPDDLSYQGDTSSQQGGSVTASSSQTRMGTSASPSAPTQTFGGAQPHNSTKGKDKSHRPKRPRVDSDNLSDDDEPHTLTMNVIMPPQTGAEGYPITTRLPGACKHCKKLKMKCTFPPGENTCNRCRGTGHVCVVEGRKPRNAPNKREYLLAQIRQKDAMIEKLLRELHNPYTATPFSIASYRLATNPSDRNKESVIDWLDRLESSVQHSGKSKGLEAFTESRAGNDTGDDSEDEAEDGGGRPTVRGSVLGYGTIDDSTKEAHDQMQALPDVAVPIGLLANLAISNSPKDKKQKNSNQATEAEDPEDDDVGFANRRYFMPGPAYDLGIRASLIQSHSPPEILVHGLVTPSDVEELFKIFYERLNVHVTLLDQDIHTPAMTFARCPFLFTVVCAIASRYYEPKSEIYPIAMHFAKRAAADGLLNGWKSVELSQAYILLSTYGVPARRWEEDRSWLYIGLAIRIATDLNLQQVSTVQPKSDSHEREIINQTRLWMICFNLDRSMATQFGKPATIKENYTIRTSENWYRRSRFNHPYDVGLCAYTQMLRIMARFHEEIFSDPTAPSGLNQAIDFHEVTLRHDEDMTRYFEDWTRRFEEDSDLQEPAYAFRASLLPFLTNYSRLVMYSFGFQQAFKRGMQPGDQIFLDKCFQSAKSVILCMIESLSPEYMRYSPDGHFIFASFASAFLLKLMRPEFANLITNEQVAEIFDLIEKLIRKLSSREIAIDMRHTPNLHARFLAGLLKKYRRDVAASGRLHPQSPSQGPVAHGSHGVHTTYASQSPSASSSTSSQPTYQTGPAPGAFHATQDIVANHIDPTAMMQSEAMYEDAAYPAGTGPMDYSSADLVENLGALLALQSPSYWNHMMMPGYSWPESPPNMAHEEFFNAAEGLNGFSNFQTAPVLHG